VPRGRPAGSPGPKAPGPQSRPRRSNADTSLWYKDAIIYELHVRTFHDSDGDGIGDFAGLTAKLNYLEELGVTAVWLLPFYPSPLRDDGYDIANYTDIHPDYGTLRDFKHFLAEAHRRGLRMSGIERPVDDRGPRFITFEPKATCWTRDGCRRSRH